MDRRKFLGFVVFPAAIAGLLGFLFFVAKIDVFRKRTTEELFLELREAKEPEMRWKAAADLAARGERRALPALRATLADPEAAVRLHAGRALVELAGAEAIPDVLPLLEDRSGEVRSTIAFELGARKLADPRVRAALAARLDEAKEPREDVRWNVAVALARLGDGAGRAVLHQMLRPASPRSVGGAVRTLVPGQETPPVEPGRKEHENALLALSHVGNLSSIGPLERFIEADIEPELAPLARAIIAGIRKQEAAAH